MFALVLLATIVAAALIALVKLLWLDSRAGGRRRGIFRARQLMTDNEIEFFARLKAALPDCAIFSQVAMSAVLDVTLPQNHREYWPTRSKFDRKRMDYVVCTSDGKRLIAVVELDDKSHESKRAQDAERDAMLARVGIRTVRFPSYPRPHPREIRAVVLGRAAAPATRAA